MNKRLFLVTAIIATLFVVTPVCASLNLIANGSFENGSYTDNGSGFQNLNAGSTNITGWTIGGTSPLNSIDWIGTYWTAADGAKSIDMSGNHFGLISQAIGTSVGTSYRVSFAMAGNPADSDKVKYLQVAATGMTTPLIFSFDTTGKGQTNMGWVTESFVFKAVNSDTTLQFTSLQGMTAYGPAIDNVSVSAVPIPAAVWLLGSGLVGLVVIRRRYKK